MKIILAYPPIKWSLPSDSAPLGIGYLTSMLKKENYDAKAIDMWDFDENKIISTLKQEDPDILGITCLTNDRFQAFNIAKIAKKLNPNIKIVMGGVHASFMPEQIFKSSPADLISIGESDYTIVDIIKNLNSLEKVHGIVYKKNNKIIKTENRPMIKNLDELPFPSYEDYNLDNYANTFIETTNNEELKKTFKNIKRVAITTSRGCPIGCQFCSTSRFWRYWRGRSAKNSVDEIEYLYDKFGIRLFNFFDDNFNMDNKRVIDICKEIINRKLDIYWNVQARVDKLNKEVLYWMKKSGCYLLRFGVESGSQKILNSINKKVQVSQIIDAFKISKKAGLETNCHVMIGNPGENKDTVNETISVLKKIKPGVVSTFGTCIFPGTPLYEISKKQDLINDDYWLKDCPAPLYTGSLSANQIRNYVFKVQSSFERSLGLMNYSRYILRNIYARKNRPKDILKIGFNYLFNR